MMNRIRTLVFAVLGWCCLYAQAGELTDALRGQRHVLLMRHAYAPGVGDPAGYRLDDCATQRNLDKQGRTQAARTGAWLKRQGVTRALVFSSVWCRCRDTAHALDLGPVSIEASLASFFDQPDQAGPATDALATFITRTLQSKSDRALILVTHHVNIRAFMGKDIGSGDMVLVNVDAQGRAVSHVLYPSPP
jgi:phosphohistidine phosphatase SixA